MRATASTGDAADDHAERWTSGFHGYWSRRVTDEHRLVHRIVEDEIRIAACRYHYGN